MLNNKQYFYFLIFFLILSNASTVAQAYEAQKDHIEVFIRGKKYNSFYAYKRERLIQNLRKDLPSSSEDHVHRLVEGLLSKFSLRQLEELMSEEFKTIVQKARDEDLPAAQEKEREGSVFQMKAMLQDYFEKHKDVESISINSRKVKTIILDPTP